MNNSNRRAGDYGRVERRQNGYKGDGQRRRHQRRLTPWERFVRSGAPKYCLVLLLGIILIVLGLLLIPNTENQKTDVMSSEAESPETTTPTIPPETTPVIETKAPSTEAETSTETEAVSSESEETIEPSVPIQYLLSEVAFVGDSRTVFMGTDANWPELSSGLISNDRLYATFGGCLFQDSAFENARNAANAHPKCAIFWYGVNDLQVNENRNDQYLFQQNYQKVINAFREIDSESDIYILSILNTDTDEKDYYASQDINLANYNKALQELCTDYGYTYVDVTGLFTGSEDFYEDNIHFTKEFYERFLPYIFEQLGIAEE